MVKSREEGRKARAAARAHWPARIGDLGDEDASVDLTDSTSAEQRLAMMWPLAVDAYRLAGIEVPDYARAEAPGRVIRPSETPESS